MTKMMTRRTTRNDSSPHHDRRRVGRLAGIAAVCAAFAALAACATPPALVPLAPAGGPVSVAKPDVVGPLRVRGNQFVDGSGRVVILHGVNSVAKWAPWVTPIDRADTPPGFDGDTLTAKDLAEMDRDGFNAVRLGVWPAALMPSPGVIDTAYLDRVEKTVKALEAHGIWVLLDMHQDVFTGMPAWATTPAAAQLSDKPDPGLTAAIGWSAAYVTPRSLRQWDDWWSNVEVAPGLGVVDAYAKGAAAVAQRFNTNPAVIGLEFINEPFAGSPFLQCVVGGCPGLDATVGQRNAQISAAVRQKAPDLPLWWDQQAFYPNYSGAQPPAPSITPASDGNQLVASFHSYCLDTDGGQPVTPSEFAQTYCDAQITEAFNRSNAVAAGFGAPSVMTEFGASRSPLNATLPTKLADEQMSSWFHWYHGSFPDVVESQLVRTSAQATAGTPLQQRFEPATGDFLLRYRPDHAITAPTSIVVPQRAYPTGYTAAVTGGHVTSAPNSGRLTVVADPGSTEVVVTVKRA